MQRDFSNYIENLQKKRSQYNYADQARTQAESLKQLSAGIYTEEERFVYELLQNAVDAFVDTDEKNLEVKIEIKGDILCFMHNGLPFSEKDIEGLCDVGRSNKASDEYSNRKKVGYKGIGFKSVFMQNVEYVCVKSGDYCFKFDKSECVTLMPKSFKEELSTDEIPWQIIPIVCDFPPEFDTSNYSVATFIKTDNANIHRLVKKITKLLKFPQFLLFLNAPSINIELYEEGKRLEKIERVSNGKEGVVCLKKNGKEVSRWLVYTTESIPVDNSVRNELNRDFNTPQKLKETTHFEISFAVSINDKNEFLKLKNDDSVVYTFLPTSYRNLRLPFLVNANFITDAGRQQLNQNSKWNSLIFEKIPECYLKWIATQSPLHKEYYKVLPNEDDLISDDLTDVFKTSLKKSISLIAFIPRLLDKKLIKVKDAIIDKVGVFSAIPKSNLIDHINTKYKKTYFYENVIATESLTLLKKYGVFIFDEECLLQMINDKNAIKGNANDNVLLINFILISGFLPKQNHIF